MPEEILNGPHHSNGSTRWYLNDYLHRTDGPAVEYDNGSKLWYLHGERHRTDGPAGEYADGDLHWWFQGNCVSFEGWLKANTEISGEEKVMLKLQYG